MGRLLRAFTLLAALIFGGGHAAAEQLRLLTEEFPPYNYEIDGVLMGESVAIVRAIQDQVGDATPIELMPWARAFRIAESEGPVGLFSTTRTPAREDRFQWVGPIATIRVSLLMTPETAARVRTLDDARQLREIGVRSGGSSEEWLRERAFENLEPLFNLQFGRFRQVFDGAYDSISGDLAEWRMIAERFDLPVGGIVEGPVLFTRQMYIAFSLATPEDTVAAWRGALDATRAAQPSP